MIDMKIGIVGAGGAGGYFAGRWAEAGLDVTLIARGQQFEAIAADGLQILSPFGDIQLPITVHNDPAALTSANLVMFATKSWQLPDAIAAVSPYLDPDTMVFGIQNGVGTIELLADSFPAQNILGATCRIISMIEKPGTIRHLGVEPAILLGETASGISERTQQLEATLNLGQQLTVTAASDIILELWKKLLFFAPVSGIGSVTRASIGEFRSVKATRDLLNSALREVVAVAQACGVNLQQTTADRVLDFIDTLPADGTSSMQRDFADGRRTELEALSGHVAKLGRGFGVSTPAHEFIYQALLPLELKARGELQC